MFPGDHKGYERQVNITGSPSRDTTVLYLRALCTSALDEGRALGILWHRDIVVFSAAKNDPRSWGEIKWMPD